MTPVNITNTIYKAVEKISRIGNDQKFSSWDNNKTHYLNLLLLVSTISATLFTLSNFFLGNPAMIICGSLILGFNAILYSLHYFKRLYLARTLTYIGYPLLFFLMILLSNGQIRGEYAFFLMILLSVMFFRTRWRQLSMMVYVTVLFLSSQIINYQQFSTAVSYQAIFNDTLIFIAIAFGLIFITDSFIKQIIETRRSNKKLLEELSSSNDELKRLNYMVSHDLRTPLRQIVSFSDLAILANQQGDSEAIQDYTEQIGYSARTLYSLTDDLLSLAHLDKDQLLSKDLSLAEIFERTKQQFVNTEDNVVIEVNHQNLHLEGNPTLLGMILQNLVENAIKYNESEVKCIQIDAQKSADDLKITVQDNGIGIPLTQKDRIFEAFQRLHTTHDYQGTGLGLAIAKKIMDLHGGKIWLESQTVGSKFVLSFPLKAVLQKTPEDNSSLGKNNLNIWRTVKERRAIF